MYKGVTMMQNYSYKVKNILKRHKNHTRYIIVFGDALRPRRLPCRDRPAPFAPLGDLRPVASSTTHRGGEGMMRFWIPCPCRDGHETGGARPCAAEGILTAVQKRGLGTMKRAVVN